MAIVAFIENTRNPLPHIHTLFPRSSLGTQLSKSSAFNIEAELLVQFHSQAGAWEREKREVLLLSLPHHMNSN